MTVDTGPDLGIPPSRCASVADVDAALIRLSARRAWIHSHGAGDSDTVWRGLLNQYLDRRSMLALAEMLKA